MKCSLGISNFLKRSLVFPILLFSSISLHWLLKKAFLSLLAILWNSATDAYIFPFLLCFLLLFLSHLFVRSSQKIICLVSFLLGDDFGHHLLYRVMNFYSWNIRFYSHFYFSALISLVYIFQFLHLFWLLFFLKPLSNVVEKLVYVCVFIYIYIVCKCNMYILENLKNFA